MFNIFKKTKKNKQPKKTDKIPVFKKENFSFKKKQQIKIKTTSIKKVLGFATKEMNRPNEIKITILKELKLLLYFILIYNNNKPDKKFVTPSKL